MKPLTNEWVNKAESDFNSALLLLRARKTPNYDGASFHAQQSAEKYLKARLQEAAVSFPRTHDLEVLLDLLLPLEPSWSLLRPKLNLLTKAAVELRGSRRPRLTPKKPWRPRAKFVPLCGSLSVSRYKSR